MELGNTVMEQPPVLLERHDKVAVLTLNNPEKRNALSRRLLETLWERFAGLAEDRDVHVIVLRAAGMMFSSGHDLRELRDIDEARATFLFDLCTRVMEQIRFLPQPVIAEVHGLATAAGCQLAASCDLVVASQTAQFATPGVKIGLFCTTPGVALSRAVNGKKAMEMLLTGQPISAEEAERAGLVNHVVPEEQLHDEAMRLARQIAAASRETIALGKRAFYEQIQRERPAAYELAQEVMVANSQSANAQEGICAFLEKRRPEWKS
jgi:enoyl-CoA hydratase/carnithine racemase